MCGAISCPCDRVAGFTTQQSERCTTPQGALHAACVVVDEVWLADVHGSLLLHSIVYKSHRGSHRAVVALVRRHALLSQHVWSDDLAHQQMNLIVLIRDAIYLHSAAACSTLGAMDTFELQLSSNVSVFDHSLQQKKRSR